GFCNPGAAPARMLVWALPCGMENFFEEIHAAMTAGEGTPKRIAELCAKYGMEGFPGTVAETAAALMGGDAPAAPNARNHAVSAACFARYLCPLRPGAGAAPALARGPQSVFADLRLLQPRILALPLDRFSQLHCPVRHSRAGARVAPS